MGCSDSRQVDRIDNIAPKHNNHNNTNTNTDNNSSSSTHNANTNRAAVITSTSTIGLSTASNPSETAEGSRHDAIASLHFDSESAMAQHWQRGGQQGVDTFGNGAASSGISYSETSNNEPIPHAGLGVPRSPAAAIARFHEDMSLGELTDVEPLANGGFCVVCSCFYRGQRAVLKVPRPRGPEGAVDDLLMEIAIYKRISQRGGHPNIARAFGSGYHLQQGAQLPFLVIERLEGGSLATALERSRPLHDEWSDPLGRLPVALELADALVFLHNDAVPGGFVLHRDLKPANIGLCGQGHVKVFDLGLSVIREIREGSNDTYQMSGMAGSKRFMAPEVCNGLPYNEKVDVYSFAVVLWEICALRKPFQGMSVADHLREVIVGGLRPPLDPRWPPGLVHLLQACWNENPDCRPSALQARDMLRGIVMTGGGGGYVGW